MAINRAKYENAILFLCSKLPGQAIRGKKKLAKLLYYIDFDRYEYEESMETVTGDQYRRMPMGPVPLEYESVAATMTDRLEIEHVAEFPGWNPTTVYRAKEAPDMSVFDETDLKILNRVARKYLSLTGKALEDLSHAEAPWIAVEQRDIIPFELAFYRDTDFSDAA